MTAALLDLISVVPETEITRYVPIVVVFSCSSELDLNSVDAIYAVNEEDKDEDKSYLHPIL